MHKLHYAVLSKYITLGLVLALLYNDWILGSLLNPHMSPYRSLISELSAVTQPYHWVFQSLDITAGILTLVFVSFVWQYTKDLRKRDRFILVGLFAFIGLDSMLDASLPISCAPSMDSACNLLATHSVLTDAHLIESNIAGVGAFLAPVLWWVYCKSKNFVISQVSFWFVIIQVAVGLGIILIKLSGMHDYGMFQRVYETGLGIWVGVVAINCYAWQTSASKESEESDLSEAVNPSLD